MGGCMKTGVPRTVNRWKYPQARVFVCLPEIVRGKRKTTALSEAITSRFKTFYYPSLHSGAWEASGAGIAF